MDVIPTIRAGADAPKSVQGKTKPQRPVLVAVVHEVLNQDRFTDLGDLTEAVKARASRLRIPYDSGRVADAVRTVAHVRPVVFTEQHANVARQVAADTGIVSPAEARRIVDELLRRTGRALPAMPSSRPGLTADAINQFKRDNGMWRR